jgi:hypothetical protein
MKRSFPLISNKKSKGYSCLQNPEMKIWTDLTQRFQNLLYEKKENYFRYKNWSWTINSKIDVRFVQMNKIKSSKVHNN